jgi:ATP-binding cassette, subfamily C, bacterial
MKLQKAASVFSFYSEYRLRALAVVGLQVISAFADSVGILALLPVIQGLVSGNASSGWIGQILASIVTSLGLPADIRGYLLLVSVAIIVRAVTSYVTQRVGNHLVLDVINSIRSRLLRALITLRWPRFARLKSGDVIGLQVSEIERFRPGLTAVLTLMTAGVQTIFYLAASLLVSVHLTLFALLLGAIKVGILRPIRRGTIKLGAVYSTNIRSMTGSLLEGLHSIKPIRAMGAEGSLQARLSRDVKQNYKAVDDLHRSSVFFTVADDFLTSAILVVVLFVCAVWLSIDLAQLAVIGLLMSRILVQVGSMQKGQQTINLTANVADSIHTTLDDYRLDAEPRQGRRETRLRRELRFDNVSLGYDGRDVISGVDLSIAAGSLCAFTGASGGGKTTLVDAVLGLVTPTKGRVLIDGIDLAEAGILAWRRHIGYVPQELVLFNDSVRSNIVFGRDGITEEDVRRALKDAEALDFVEAMPRGLETPVGERGTALSGGQRQRLALARALVHSPDLLILDEATTALDPATEIEICRTFRRLAGERTILAIAHQPRIAEIADLVVEVAGGSARVVSAELAKVAAVAK